MADEKQGQGGAMGRKGQLWLIVALSVGMLVAMVVWFNWWDRGGLHSDVKAVEVASNGLPYYGKTMRISGHVTEVLSERLFIMGDPLQGTAALPVLVKEAGVAVKVGDPVLVEGAPTAFAAARIREQVGMDVPELQTRGWENRPVVIAEKVLTMK